MDKIPAPLVRSQIYKQLYHALYYPAEDAGILLAVRMGPTFFAEMGHPRIKEKAEDLCITAGKVDAEDLQVEYVRLFDYKPVCPPYESSCRRDMRGQELAADLVASYRQAGVECDDAMIPDHFSVEFEFMHYLAYKESSPDEPPSKGWKELERKFLEEHILKWVPQFCMLLSREGKEPYNRIGDLIQDFLVLEETGFCRP